MTTDVARTTNDIVLEMATNPDLDVTKLKELLELRDRDMARESRLAFNAAVAAFQAEVPDIPQTRGVKFDERAGAKVAYTYANLSDIERIVRPVLLRHGLSYTFTTRLDDQTMTAICRLSHVDGHREESEFGAVIGKQAKMNTVQSSGSTRQYCKRYALTDALGISTCDADTDANEPVEPITDDQLANLASLMQEVFAPEEFDARKKKFLAFLGCELSDLPQSRYNEAKSALERCR